MDDAHDGGLLHQVGIVGVQLVIIVEHWVCCKRGGKVEVESDATNNGVMIVGDDEIGLQLRAFGDDGLHEWLL